MPSTPNAAATAEAQGPIVKVPHTCGQSGAYGELKDTGTCETDEGTLNRDHIPAKATLYKRALRNHRGMSDDVKACVKKETEARGLAICIPAGMHQQKSPTYGGRNKKKIGPDSKTPESIAAAKDRDTKAMQKHLNKVGPKACADAYRAAVRAIKKFDVDKMIREAVADCKAK